MPFCSATWAIAVVCPESKAPTKSLGAVADQLLGAGARGIDVRFGIAVNDGEFRQAKRLEDRRRDIDAALAILADAGLVAGTRQNHANLQRAALGAHDIERRGSGNECGRSGAGGKGAARDAH